MFVIKSKNLIGFVRRISLKNINILFNSISLYLRTLAYQHWGVFSENNDKSDFSAILLIHFGIGDFFNMLPAIEHISRQYNGLHVLVRRQYISEFSKLVSDSNIQLKAVEDEMLSGDYYDIDLDQLQSKYPACKIIAVGKLNKKMTFMYPVSYYLELGVDPKIAFSQKIVLKNDSIREEVVNFYEKLKVPYIFTHLVASDAEIEWDQSLGGDILILDPLKNRNQYPSDNFDIAQKYLNLNLNLIEHLYFMLKSNKCILIDSAFFNFLAHSDYSGKAYVYLRGTYFHKLDERLIVNFDVLTVPG